MEDLVEFCQGIKWFNSYDVNRWSGDTHIANSDKNVYLQTYRSQQHEICMEL